MELESTPTSACAGIPWLCTDTRSCTTQLSPGADCTLIPPPSQSKPLRSWEKEDNQQVCSTWQLAFGEFTRESLILSQTSLRGPSRCLPYHELRWKYQFLGWIQWQKLSFREEVWNYLKKRKYQKLAPTSKGKGSKEVRFAVRCATNRWMCRWPARILEQPIKGCPADAVTKNSVQVWQASEPPSTHCTLS